MRRSCVACAEEVIDYRAVRFEEIAREIDVAFDTVAATRLTAWASWCLAAGRHHSRFLEAALQTLVKANAQAFFIVRLIVCSCKRDRSTDRHWQLRPVLLIAASFPGTPGVRAQRRRAR